MDDKLLDQLAYELGEILKYKEQCPGVYYLGVQPTEGIFGWEYYVVLKDAPISKEVRAMRRQLEDIPALLHPIDAKEGPRFAVEYEVLRYLTTRGLPCQKARPCGRPRCMGWSCAQTTSVHIRPHS